jgi:hypothetical protein
MRARIVGDDLKAVQQGRLRRGVVVHPFDCTRKTARPRAGFCYDPLDAHNAAAHRPRPDPRPFPFALCRARAREPTRGGPGVRTDVGARRYGQITGSNCGA